MSTQNTHCQSALRVLEVEKKAIEHLEQYIDETFSAACELIRHCQGKVIVMGMGKSGHIGRKIAATFASTGTPSFFVHPGEASHGDLGMIGKGDVVLAISNSGESDEVLKLIPVLKRLHIPIISMTGKPSSSMAQLAQYHLCIKVPEEACPLGLAPTSSTTATLVMGDALAVSLLTSRGFTANDFALSHPGGALGRRLLLKVNDVMHKGLLCPQVSESAKLPEALMEMSSKGLGMTAVVNDKNQVSGLFTDGDLRRVFDKAIDVHQAPISDVMTHNPITVTPEMLAAEALAIMEDKKINGLLVVDSQTKKLIGALNMHDLLKAGVL